MTPAIIFEALTFFLKLLDRFTQGDAQAAQRLKDILPARTYTRMVREREKTLDKAKFG